MTNDLISLNLINQLGIFAKEKKNLNSILTFPIKWLRRISNTK